MPTRQVGRFLVYPLDLEKRSLNSQHGYWYYRFTLVFIRPVGVFVHDLDWCSCSAEFTYGARVNGAVLVCI